MAAPSKTAIPLRDMQDAIESHLRLSRDAFSFRRSVVSDFALSVLKLRQRRLLEDAGILHPRPVSHAMTVAPPSLYGLRFAQSARVAISHLEPPSDAQSSRHIRAVVALVWPYSSSTRALTLLLAEPDIRLRKGKGQVKVTFYGPSAEAVAKGQVGIGDTVQLGLEGAQWVRTDENVSTPGKKIEWDLVFDGRADLDVKRDSQVVATINVDCPTQASVTVDPSWTQRLETSLNGSGPTQYANHANTWSSPIFVKGKRPSSGSFFDASLDPFADDDGFVVGKGRKRTKFARHSDSWRLLDRTPSPEKELVDLPLDDINGSTETALHSQPQSPNQDVEAVDNRPVDGATLASMAGTASTAVVHIQPSLHLPKSPRVEIVPQGPDVAGRPHSPPRGPGQMLPPTTPPRSVPHVSGTIIDSGAQKEVQSPARSDLKTPRLGPIPSPGLPLVSPLIRRPSLSSGYFPDLLERRSELDASGAQQQSLPALEGRVAVSYDLAPSPEVEQVSLLSPTETEQLHASELEVITRETLFELNSPLQQLSPQLDQPVQPMSWSSFPEGVQQAHFIPHEQEKEPGNAEAFDFEFLNTSPMDANTDGQNMWHFSDISAGTVATPETHKDAGSLEPAETSNRPADLLGVITHAMPQYDARNASVPHYFSKSGTPTPHVVVGTQDEDVDAISDVVPDSSPRAPIDPSLVTSLETAREFVSSSKEDAQIAEELPKPVRDSHPWSDKLDVSAVDAESQRVYTAPPFPFEQHWHRRPSSQQSIRSSQYASLDGVGDAISGDQTSEVEDIYDGSRRLEIPDHDLRSDYGLEFGKIARDSNLAPSLVPSDEPRYENTHIPGKDMGSLDVQAPDCRQSVIVLDSSDECAPSSIEPKSKVKTAVANSGVGPPEDAVDLKTSKVDDVQTEILMRVRNIQGLQGDGVEDLTLPLFSAHGEPPGSAIDTTAVTDRERTQTKISSNTRQDLCGNTSKPSTESANLTRPLEERPAQILSHQLVTPENTQEQGGDTHLQGHTAEGRGEISLPPTPQNTQEYADLPQPTVELPISTDTAIGAYRTAKMPVLTSVDNIRERRRSPRLSRKFPPSQDMTEVVSPYFTPRRTNRIRDQAQLVTTPKSTIIETGLAAVNDTTQMIEKVSKLNYNALPNKEAAPGSPLLGRPQAGLTTSLSYYPPLSMLQDHFSQSIDVLALSTTSSTEPLRAKSGPRDWHTTIHLTSPSLQGNKTITAQIFRPYEIGLPKVQRGNLVLLRNFKVQSQKRKCMLLSTESSAWIVFSVRKEIGAEISNIDTVIEGPPVEYGAEEKSYVIELKKWWDAEGEDRHPVQKQANQTSKVVPVISDGDGDMVNHELHDGKVYQDHKESDEQGDVSEPYHELRDGRLYRDDTPSKGSDSDRKSGETDDQMNDVAILHELRDGTVYRDDISSRAPRRRQKSSYITRKAATDAEDVKTRKESRSRNDDPDASQELESIDVDAKAETDSGEESPTNEAVSSQIYHELRNGRRYADPVPGQKHAEELQQQEGEDEDESVVHELRDGVTYING